MKSVKQIISISIILAILFSCTQGRNKLKTDEEVLKKEILSQEEQLEQKRSEREKQLADSLSKLPKGFRFAEERGVDPLHKPMVIDIANSLDSVRTFKLSDVASNIEYIRMEAVPDSTLLTNMKYKYYLMDNYLIASNLYGIHLFTNDGHFIRSIVKNEMSGVSYNEKKDRVMYLWSEYMEIGGGTNLWARGNTLFYFYQNSTTGQRYIMEYNCSNNESIETSQFDPENPNQIRGAGKISVDLNYGHTTPPVKRNRHGAMTMDMQSMYSGMGLFAPDRNTMVHVMRGKNMLCISSSQGDTLAAFTKYEQLKNYTKSLMRGTDHGTSYEKGGDLFFRTDFNDTIFQVIPPNRLLPVYVLNLGQFKLTKQEGVDPGVSLEGKIIPQDFADTKDYLFMTFTKDSYDCPNSRRSKELKLYRALFNKINQQLSILTTDPTYYDVPILKNDIDGGISVWPDAYNVGKKGEIWKALTGAELKAHVASDAFKSSNAPIAKKEALKSLAEKVRDEEQILMIVK